MRPYRITPEQYPAHFWSKVDRRTPDECWPFMAFKDSGGYGVIRYHSKNTHAHRVAWILANGDIPNRLCVLHKCDNPPCCNPDHLFLGTRLDNAKDMVHKKRGRKNVGEKSPNAKLTAEQVTEIRRLHSTGNFSFPRLAKIFGVTHGNIQWIVHRRTWKHID